MMRLTQEECNTGHDDDQSDEVDSYTGSNESPRLRLTISKGVTATHGHIDLRIRAQHWAARVRHKHCDHVLSCLQVHEGLKHRMGICRGEEEDVRLEDSWAEMAKVHTSFTKVEVQILVFKNTLVKVEVLTKLLYSNKSKEVWVSKCT